MIEVLTSSHLGTEAGCLRLLDDAVRTNVAEHEQEILHSVEVFLQAQAAFRAFLGRIVQAAVATGSSNVRENDYQAARAQCGLIWWCD
jgi:hypothetical protein